MTTPSRRGRDVELHSDYYRADDGRPFKMAIIDALAANPEGLTVPGVREWLYDTHHFILASLPSFLRSFGHEQAGETVARASRVNEKVSPRYSGWPGDDFPDGQVAYALTERLDWWMTRMRVQKQVRSIGFDNDSPDPILIAISGRRNAGIGVYVVGPKPIRIKTIVPQVVTINYEPGATDWGERVMVWQKNADEELDRKTRRVAHLVELVKEADRIFRKDDAWNR